MIPMLRTFFIYPLLIISKRTICTHVHSRWRVRGDQRPQSGHCTLSQPARICQGIYRYVNHYNNKEITFVAKHPFYRDSLFVCICIDITYSYSHC